MTSRVCRFLAQWCWDLLLTRKNRYLIIAKIDKNRNQRKKRNLKKNLLKNNNNNKIAKSSNCKSNVICGQSFDNGKNGDRILTKKKNSGTGRISFSFLWIEFRTEFSKDGIFFFFFWFDLVVGTVWSEPNGSQKCWFSQRCAIDLVSY